MNFNSQQQQVINTVNGNISVIATAGSGKTTVLTYRIKNMIENCNYSPSSILAVTFSKKAKDNICEKLKELNIYGVQVETFHSLALKIITSIYGINHYKIWTEQWEKEKLLQDICLSLGVCNTSDEVPINELSSFISTQKVYMKNPDMELIYSLDQPFRSEYMKKIYSLYEESKKGMSYIEFDDFLNLANEILDTNPRILENYRDLFQYVMVDEFQDISLSQSLLLKKLNSNNTMIVGDPLQAIYSFRGGNNKYILDFYEDYNNTKIVNLNVNYRCSKDIIKTANQLALSIPDSKHIYYVESVANKSNYKVPELHHFPDEYKEAEWISQEIMKLKTRGYSYNDIAILSRTNAQLQKLETTLHNSNISFDIVDGNIFTDLPEIKLVISYLRLALDKNDNYAFEYLYNKPNRWLSQKFLKETKENSYQKNICLYDSMFTIARRNWRFKSGIDEIVEVIQSLQIKKWDNMSQLVSYLRQRLNIDLFVTKGKPSDDGTYSEQIENLDSFENLCARYTTIQELIFYLNNLSQEIRLDKKEKITLSTIHKSKGLEYPVVFIIGCNNDLFPHYKSNNEESINDECRLMYVGITRAEKELYLSYVDNYNNKKMYISPFIKSIQSSINIINRN